MSARTPEDVDRLFGEYLNAGDAASVAALYEAEAVLAQPGGDAVGPAAIRAALESLVAAKVRLEMKVVKVKRAGDVAVLYNDWSGTATGPDGQPVHLSGKAMEIVRRQPDGTWKFVVDDPYARGA